MVALIGGSATAHAGQISVDDALAAAEARNPAVAEAEARVAQASGRGITAAQWVPSRPELALGVESDALFARDGEGALDVGISQELELFGQRGLRIRVAREDRAARSFDVDDERRRLRAETQAAYYELMFQERRLALAADVAETATRLVESARQRVGAGDLGEAELELLVGDLALARSDRRAAEGDAGVARAALDRLIGENDGAATATTGDFPALTASGDAGALAARAVDERPDLAAAARDLATARAEVALRRRERLPNLTVSIGYVYDRGVLGADDFSPPVIDRAFDADHLFTVGLSLPLPLFRSNAGEVAQARGRTAEAEARQAGIEARIGEDVAAAVARRDAARDRIGELDEAATAVATTLARYEKAWTEKHIDLAEYLAIRDRVLAVQVSALEARRDGAVADAELERAVGGDAR